MSRITRGVVHSANPNSNIVPVSAYGMITDQSNDIPLMKFTGDAYFNPSLNQYCFPFRWGDTPVTSEKFESICQNVFPEDAKVELCWFISFTIKFARILPYYNDDGTAVPWWNTSGAGELDSTRLAESLTDFKWIAALTTPI